MCITVFHFQKETCNNLWFQVASITGYSLVRLADEYQLKVALITQGPVAVVMDGSDQDLMLYDSGEYLVSKLS